MQTTQTLAALLAPLKTGVVAEHVGRSRNAVHAWKSGKGIPDVTCIPILADLLRYDLAELTLIVAADSERISRQRDAAA